LTDLELNAVSEEARRRRAPPINPMIVVDAHNDLLALVVRRPRAEQAAYFRSRWLPQLRDGDVAVQVLPVYTSREDLREVFCMIEAAHRVAEANADAVSICLTGSDIDVALDQGKIALVISIEGCGAFGRELALLETAFRLGVRMVSFTHMGRTALADGSGEDATGSALTRAGIEALALLEDLGALMDVSHLSASGVDDVLERARRPVIASHSSAFTLRQHHRNLTDERLRGIAATGGVVGVNFMAGLVDPDEPTLDRLIDHVLYIVSVAGIDHVGFGPDFIQEYAIETYVDDLILEGVSLKQAIPGLGGPAGLPLVARAFEARGVPQDDIRAILAGNWLRVLRAEMGVPASDRG
jgi:membrane dipeptidase